MPMAEHDSAFPKPVTIKKNLLIRLFFALALLGGFFLTILEIGRFWVSYSAVRAAVRDALDYGSQPGLAKNGVPHYQDCDGIRKSALRTAPFGGFTASDIFISYGQRETEALEMGLVSNCPNFLPGQNQLNVELKSHFKPIPLISFGAIQINKKDSRYIGSAQNGMIVEPLITLPPSLTPTRLKITSTTNPSLMTTNTNLLTPTSVSTQTAPLNTPRPSVPFLTNTTEVHFTSNPTGTPSRTPSATGSIMPTHTFTTTPSRTPTQIPVRTATKTFTIEPSPTWAPCQIPAEAGGCQ